VYNYHNCNVQTTRASSVHLGSGCQVPARATSSFVRGWLGTRRSGDVHRTAGTC